MLIEGGYVVTNAHVVWPFDEVRVVFPNGADFTAAPVKSIDVLGDLAVIGPIDFCDPGKLQTPDLPAPRPSLHRYEYLPRRWYSRTERTWLSVVTGS